MFNDLLFGNLIWSGATQYCLDNLLLPGVNIVCTAEMGFSTFPPWFHHHCYMELFSSLPRYHSSDVLEDWCIRFRMCPVWGVYRCAFTSKPIFHTHNSFFISYVLDTINILLQTDDGTSSCEKSERTLDTSPVGSRDGSLSWTTTIAIIGLILNHLFHISLI